MPQQVHAVPKGTLVGQQYVTQAETTLVLKEMAHGKYSSMGDSDNFTVTDTNGTLWFQVGCLFICVYTQQRSPPSAHSKMRTCLACWTSARSSTRAARCVELFADCAY